jgi:hypothetical protein
VPGRIIQGRIGRVGAAGAGDYSWHKSGRGHRRLDEAVPRIEEPRIRSFAHCELCARSKAGFGGRFANSVLAVSRTVVSREFPLAMRRRFAPPSLAIRVLRRWSNGACPAQVCRV